LPVELEFLKPLRLYFLNSDLLQSSPDGRLQNIRLGWPGRKPALWLLKKGLENKSDQAVSQAYFQALNRNRAPAPALYAGPPGSGQVERLLLEEAQFEQKEIIEAILPAPFLPAGSAVYILTFKDSSNICREILLPARVLSGNQILEGYFQLHGLLIAELSIGSPHQASYRLRRSGIRIALALDGQPPVAATFRPDRFIDQFDKLPALLLQPGLLFRLTEKFHLEIYEQSFSFALNQIAIADTVDDSGYYTELRRLLGLPWQEIHTHLLPKVLLRRQLFSAMPLARAGLNFPLPARAALFTRA
jgi:hypothetical protein